MFPACTFGAETGLLNASCNPLSDPLVKDVITAPAGQSATDALTFGAEKVIFENVQEKSAADPATLLYAESLMDFPTQFPSPALSAVRVSVTVIVST